MSPQPSDRVMTPYQVGRAGELFVAAEIHRRGGYTMTFSGNMPGIDLLACDKEQARRISIQVKAKQAGTWHSRGKHGQDCEPTTDELDFWIFVDLASGSPLYYIAPRSFVLRGIWDVRNCWREAHDGREPPSDHHAIKLKDVDSWRDRWDVLGIF